jgi:hypothetical protein
MAKKNRRIEALERQLLGDIRDLASREFVYEDFWCGMVPFDGKLSELQTGPPVPFAELHWREQADVLRGFIHWDRFPERAWDDEYRILDNIAAGKQPEQWLDGTSLRESFRLLAEGKTPPTPKQAPEITQQVLADLHAALAVAEGDRAVEKTGDGKTSLTELRKESQAQEKPRDSRKARDAEKGGDRKIER